MHIHTHTHIHTYIHTHTRTHTHTHSHVHTRTHTCTHTHTHAHTHARTHIHSPTFSPSRWVTRSFTTSTNPQKHMWLSCGPGKLPGTLQHNATHCNILQHTASCGRGKWLGLMTRVVCMSPLRAPAVVAVVTRSVLQRVAECISLLPCVAVCCSVLEVCCSMLQRVADCCSVLQCVAMRCCMWQCVAVCYCGEPFLKERALSNIMPSVDGVAAFSNTAHNAYIHTCTHMYTHTHLHTYLRVDFLLKTDSGFPKDTLLSILSIYSALVFFS